MKQSRAGLKLCEWIQKEKEANEKLHKSVKKTNEKQSTDQQRMGEVKLNYFNQ